MGAPGKRRTAVRGAGWGCRGAECRRGPGMLTWYPCVVQEQQRKAAAAARGVAPAEEPAAEGANGGGSSAAM